MKNKVQISKINIKIGDKEIPLSLDEARELRQVLDEMFGEKVTITPSYPIIIREPVYPRVYPYWYVTTTGDTVTFSNTGSSSGSGNTAINPNTPFTLTDGDNLTPLPVS